VMRRSGLGEHADGDPEETGDLGHACPPASVGPGNAIEAFVGRARSGGADCKRIS